MGWQRDLTSAGDHVVLVGLVQRPAVVLAVVQVVPATGRANAANTHLQTTHTTPAERKDHNPLVIQLHRRIICSVYRSLSNENKQQKVSLTRTLKTAHSVKNLLRL